jgi:hypothetical protein
VCVGWHEFVVTHPDVGEVLTVVVVCVVVVWPGCVCGVVVGVVVVVWPGCVVVAGPQWSSLPRARPWSSQSFPFVDGSGLHGLLLAPCEQSSPGDPGTLVDGPGGPSPATAATAAKPATASAKAASKKKNLRIG